jgi:hypothetical protein
MLRRKIGADLEYKISITRGNEIVDSTTITADSYDAVFQSARQWAAALGLAPHDNVELRIEYPDGSYKLYWRSAF